MDEKTEAMLKKINRGVIVNRVILILILIISSVAMGFSIATHVRINVFIDKAEPAIENLAKLDMDAFNDALYTVNQTVDVLKIDEALDMLSQIDFNAFNDVVSNIDVDELNNTLDHLNDSYLAIKDVTEKLKPLLSFFGGN